MNGHATATPRSRLADLPEYVSPPHPSEMRAVAPANAKRKATNPKALARFRTMNEFVDLSARLVDTTAQAVWLAIFREVQPSGVARVSFGRIAERIGVSRRTVIRAVKQLEEAKLITVVERGSVKDGPSTYRVHGTPTEANR